MYEPDIRSLSWEATVQTLPPADRDLFLWWWRNHPQFSYNFDWQKLIAEAWREGARQARAQAVQQRPDVEEIIAALKQHPDLCAQVREALVEGEWEATVAAEQARYEGR